MRFLVVCGLSETMAILVPTSRLSSVDLPAFGRPTRETKPDFIIRLQAPGSSLQATSGPRLWLQPDRPGACSLEPAAWFSRPLLVIALDHRGALELPDPHLVHPPALGFEHLDVQPVHLEHVANGGHTPHLAQDEAAHRLEALALDVNFEALGQLVDVGLPAEHEDAVALVHDGLRLDVVLIADLTDDLLEEILDGHEARGAAVLVDDDGRLHLLALKVLQQ